MQELKVLRAVLLIQFKYEDYFTLKMVASCYSQKVKLSRYRPEQAHGRSGRLRPRIFLTIGTEGGRSLALRTGRLYLQEYPGIHF
jgi:hypothetical protein